MSLLTVAFFAMGESIPSVPHQVVAVRSTAADLGANFPGRRGARHRSSSTPPRRRRPRPQSTSGGVSQHRRRPTVDATHPTPSPPRWTVVMMAQRKPPARLLSPGGGRLGDFTGGRKARSQTARGGLTSFLLSIKKLYSLSVVFGYK